MAGDKDRWDELDDETYGLTEAEAAEAYTFGDDVQASLEEMGLHVSMERPTVHEACEGIFTGLEIGDYYDGRLPPVIKDLSLDQLSALYSMASAWLRYVTQRLNEARTKKAETARQEELMKSLVRMRHKKNGKALQINLTDQQCSDITRYDERYVRPSAAYGYAQQLFESIDSLRKLAEKDMEVISREVTIKDIQINAEARGRSIEDGPKRFNARETMAPSPEPNRSKPTRKPVRMERNVETEADEAPEKPTRKKVTKRAKIPAKRSKAKKAPRKAKE